MTIRYSPAFFKKLKKADIRIKKSVKQRILLFSKNPDNSQLNNHPLKREYKGHRSIDITADWRALYTENFGKEKMLLHILLFSEPTSSYIDKDKRWVDI